VSCEVRGQGYDGPVSQVHLEDVFKIGGVPTHTFVEPSEYARLKVALRTPGRGLIIEGPSGIGKSTAVTRALAELDADGSVQPLSARDPGDVGYIELLPETPDGWTASSPGQRCSWPARSIPNCLVYTPPEGCYRYRVIAGNPGSASEGDLRTWDGVRWSRSPKITADGKGLNRDGLCDL